MLRAGKSELLIASCSAFCAGFWPSLYSKTLRFVSLNATALGDTQGSSHLNGHRDSSEDLTEVKS